MSDTIQIKRGMRKNLPKKLALGEPAFCYDTGEIYVGLGNDIMPVVGTTVHVGDKPPNNENLIWVNDVDEMIEGSFDSEILDEFRATIRDLQQQIADIHYALRYELDSGFFKDGEYSKELIPEEDIKGNINHVSIKRGKREELKRLLDGELGYCKDTGELFIGNEGRLEKIGAQGGSENPGGGEVAIAHLDMESANGTVFRISISNEGKFMIQKISLEPPVDPDPGPEDPDPDQDLGYLYTGLIINQVYGGGALNCGGTPVSHSFVELYNTTDKEINLAGLSLQYARTQKLWEVLPLTGKIPPKCSFTIRCGIHTPLTDNTARLKITKFDQEWPIAFNDNGFKVFLAYGKKAIDVVNPFDSKNNPTNPERCFGYIDLVGVSAFQELPSTRNSTVTIDGYEKAAAPFISKTKAAHRIDFADTHDNSKDFEPLDYTLVDPAVYGPRTVSDGTWDLYFDKSQMDPDKPNMLNMTFGADPETSRCFTWHTLPTLNGALLYKKEGEANFTSVISSRESITHPNVITTAHRVILKNLTPGKYIYKVGEAGKWSPDYSFTIKATDNESSFTMLQITDQQGWNAFEYSAWRRAWNYIKANEGFDWILNTGDMSQNGNRIFEWLDYFNGAKEDFAQTVCMSTVGNNDLIDKVSSLPFTYYYTFEDSPYTSVYSFDYGPVHFVCLNSNELVTEQETWVREDLAKTTKPWKVVYTHDGPYTVDRKSKLSKFDKVFEECGVQLVICGHRHYYMRSKPMYQNKVDTVNGIQYVMGQATGYKSGETRLWQDWYEVGMHPQSPCYIMWDIKPDRIIFTPYEIKNILPLEIPNNLEPVKSELEPPFTIMRK